MAMIVESSALYSIVAIVYVPLRMLYTGSAELDSTAFTMIYASFSGMFYSTIVCSFVFMF
jgi:hypothetical protein